MDEKKKKNKRKELDLLRIDLIHIASISYVRTFVGMPEGRHYPHGIQMPLSGDPSSSRNAVFDPEPSISTNLPPNTSSPAQFVVNPIGMGPRSVPKRSTFIRTRHFDTSTDDLLHDQQKHEHNQLSSNTSPSQHAHLSSHSRTKTTSSTSEHDSHVRLRPIHGASNSRNFSGHESGRNCDETTCRL
jgi:hypothetical protein